MSNAERKIISLQHVQDKQPLLLYHMQKKIIFMPEAYITNPLKHYKYHISQ